MTIYGTDVDAIEAALDRIGTDQRERITVVASDYSFADLRDVAARADAALLANGLAPLWISPRYDGSGVDVEIERTQGRSDDELVTAATAALAGLPVFVIASDPPVPL